MKMYCIFVWEERSAEEGSLGTVQIKDTTPKQREQLLCTCVIICEGDVQP